MIKKQFSMLVCCACAFMASDARPQTADLSLDPARDPSTLNEPKHVMLPEQYIWTAGDAAALQPNHPKLSFRDVNRKTDPHAFRGTFKLSSVPTEATLYIAGCRSVKAYLNGKRVLEDAADLKSPVGIHVFRVELHSELRVGVNVLAIEAIRGRGVVVNTDSPVIQQLAYGEALVAKIVPAAPGLETLPLVTTDASWRSTTGARPGWWAEEFDDHAWASVQSMGSIESAPEFFQWNIDAGMYNWPGYIGMSRYLRTYSLLPIAGTYRTGGLANVEALTRPSASDEFTVTMPGTDTSTANAPSLLLDFGREVSGRILIDSDCDCEAQVLLTYGESDSEALTLHNYLGTNLLRVPARGVARGPKSGFRYALLHFVGGAPHTAFRSIRLEGIAYPIQYRGSFESSDPLLNRIWETAAHTAHLCMQDGVWDAPKRDRGWWAGDLDTTGLVISDVFGDSFLLNDTLTRLIPPAGQHVNGIPSYTTLWITALASLYRHTGDKSIIEQKHDVLLRLLAQMDHDLDPSGHFVNPDHLWLFVDWAPDLVAYGNAAPEGTELEFVRGYREGAWLLDELHDSSMATHYRDMAKRVAEDARTRLASGNRTYGDQWQLSAMAVLAGVAKDSEYAALWQNGLSHVGPGTQEQLISPYFNYYVIEAMAKLGHRREALDWLRTYWGGMLDEGASSFWESYDLRWPKENPHAGLKVGDTTGYFVSMAHAWSSGPAAWLMEQVLGIQATGVGFQRVEVRPELAGLKWVRGAVPTPHGAIRVSADDTHVDVTIPDGTEATVLLPSGRWTRNGSPIYTEAVESGARVQVVLRTAGRYSFTRR